ncbi:fungal-specific transcription factor domain-containing protein [Xylaria bambusicola]|uniref:fungal-specific transcription factor domain-containing protein n=1 Tax=Xylaria bambusicola TaxID=326684 RepID=UPI0020086224|nr:fungal-specific transcription factor domain-containing protein [Xylaria bambusicola]KAI0509640.1 fungal-specific transcription factor domain-containing protein [Xylaria bambusicola]
MQSDIDDLPPLRERVSQACDTCKQRKVKCDGKVPCGYCKRRHREKTCRFSPSVRRRRLPSVLSETPTTNVSTPSSRIWPATPTTTPTVPIPTVIHVSPTLTRQSDVSAEEEAEVPRDARLICDAQGRLVFTGDCAPLSLFQTVRQIVTTRVDPHAFSPETSRVSMLENVSSEGLVPIDSAGEPEINQASIQRLVNTFLTVISGLVDLFDNNTLIPEIQSWANQAKRPVDVTAAVYYLVLAIGSQSEDEQLATTYFLRGKHLALSTLTGNLSVGTVQSFLLTTLYMLRSCQINAAFLFFGIAARAAYAIGLHRTEVNSRFGPEVHVRRDRLWKSIRVLDLYLSISMGRPPAASDADCTVPYHNTSDDGSERYDLLNASVQILSLVEGIVQEVYSRRKISLQLTEGISRQLRDWSNKWLSALLRMSRNQDNGERTGACQVLSSYYYAVMLVSRPFLMYELCRRLPESVASPPRPTAPAAETNGSGRTKLANACIDAATLMIGLTSDFISQRPSDKRMPLLVSWLFVSSLVVSVGHLSNFGRALGKPAEESIRALEYFASQDAHASQYARIAQSLHRCAQSYLARQDAEDRRRIAESSTQLFGLMPKDHETNNQNNGRPNTSGTRYPEVRVSDPTGLEPWSSGPFDDFDPAIFSFGESHTPLADIRVPQGQGHGYVHEGSADQVFGAMNLFPLLDGNGHIDLAHLL